MRMLEVLECRAAMREDDKRESVSSLSIDGGGRGGVGRPHRQCQASFTMEGRVESRDMHDFRKVATMTVYQDARLAVPSTWHNNPA